MNSSQPLGRRPAFRENPDRLRNIDLGPDRPHEHIRAMASGLLASLRTAKDQIDGWKEIAHTDKLTGLLDRRGFEYEAEKIILETPPEYRHNLALVVFDLDRLKSLNDEFGHAAGDRGIVSFGQYLENNLRSNDTVCHNISARHGGDEFIALLDLRPRDDNEFISPKSPSNDSRLHAVMGRVKYGFESGIVANDTQFQTANLGVSAGALFYDPELSSVHEWIDAADRQMYNQKQARPDLQR